MANTIKIDVLADVKGINKGVQDVNSKLTGMGQTVGRIGGLLKGAFIAGGITAGVGLLGNKFTEANQSIQEQQKLLGQTNAVLKSTGGAAGVTANDVLSLADAIEKKSTLDAEAVQSGQNLLLTFTNVRNAAGKGNDIFNQTTQIMADMSTALGQDTKSSALQLGKALNDPIKGVTALSRVGVSFTEAQKKQIKTLQESGNTMGAQKIILAELNKEFGGSAAAAGRTAGGQFKHLKDTLDGVFESIVAKVLPTLVKLAGWLAANIPVAIEKITPTVQDLGRFFGDVGGVLNSTVVPALKSTAKFIGENATLFKSLAVGIGAIVALVTVWMTVTRAFTAVQAALNVVMSLNPIGLVILAIAGLVAGLIYAYKHSAKFRNVVDGAFKAVKTAITSVVRFFKALPGNIAKAVGDTAKTLYTKGRSFIVGLATGYASYIRTVVTFFATLPGNVVRWIGNTASTLYQKGRGLIVGLANGYVSLTRNVASFFGGIAGDVLRWIGSTASTLTQKGKDFVSGLVSGLKSKASDIATWARNLPGDIVNKIGNVGSKLTSAGSDLVGGFIQGIKNRAGDIVSTIKNSITDKIPGFVRDKLGIHSPSTVMRDIGQWTVAGLVKGLSDANAVKKAASALSGAVSTGFVAPDLAVSGAGTGSMTYSPTYNIYDATDPKRVVDAIKKYEAQNSDRWRR